jgi:hypothetical protein
LAGKTRKDRERKDAPKKGLKKDVCERKDFTRTQYWQKEKVKNYSRS